jgi:lipopolysaccharide export system permease protein
LKKIDKLIATSFIGPAILSFFVATFVLVMQFLWKYVDEILGKGLTILELLELIFYYAVTLIPMAVPITVLISSVMVFGDMAEKYELSSMKSAGVSLVRIMVPSMVVAFFIGLFSLFAANFLKPASLLQFNKRFLAIRKQKSALAIEEGIFNSAFNETIIRVNKIDKNKRNIHDVLIYDHTPNDKSLIGVMTAKGGEMYTAEEGKYFVMKLDSGVQYKELEKKSKLGSNKSEIPFMRTYFDHWTKTFDMSLFDAEEGLLNFNRNREDMMNSAQLLKSIDTFRTNIRENDGKISQKMALLFQDTPQKTTPTPENLSKPDSLKKDSDLSLSTSTELKAVSTDTLLRSSTINALIKDSLRTEKDKLVAAYNKQIKKSSTALPTTVIKPVVPEPKLIQQKVSLQNVEYFLETIDSTDERDVIVRAQADLSRDRDELLTLKNVNYDFSRSYEKYLLRLNQQYSWSLVCLIFLFIGAPLGSIIRKGGYGYPLLVAILFYMIFIITTILGEKLVRNETMGGIMAAWLPCLILVPWSFILTWMALRDIKFNPQAALDFIYKFKKSSQSPLEG